MFDGDYSMGRSTQIILSFAVSQVGSQASTRPTGHLGVPVALVCGDDTVDAEVGALMPWAERVITKWAISPFSARNLTPKASQKRIREGVKRALDRLSEMKPLVIEAPIHLEVDLMQPIFARPCCRHSRRGARRRAYPSLYWRRYAGSNPHLAADHQHKSR